MYLEYLATIIDKFVPGSGAQNILNDEMQAYAAAILEAFELSGAPSLTFVDVTAVRVEAGDDYPARVVMCGIPNPLHPRTFISGGLSDGRYRANTSNATMDFDTSSTFWGTEKASQYYALLATAAGVDTTFELKAMPWLRVKSQATKTISFGTNLVPATGIGYGFTTDEFVDAKILVISGASKGLIRTITANNNDDSTGGTLTYDGDTLTLSAGDWFIILPNTNFRYLRDIFNNASSDINIGHVPGTLTLGMAGRVCVEKQTFSGVSSFTFSGLIPGEKYILEIALTQVGASAHHVITINGDTSSIYVVEAIVTTGGAPTYGTYVTAQGFPLTLGSYTSFVNYPAKFTIEFNTMFADSKKVVMNGYGGYMRNGGMAQFVGTCYYPGAANLSSIIYSTASGTLTGTAYLYRLN